tara:strand:- start:1738 stop:2595 length:858 start_codon:yes stop_codon:yes gene_type:complete
MSKEVVMKILSGLFGSGKKKSQKLEPYNDPDVSTDVLTPPPKKTSMSTMISEIATSFTRRKPWDKLNDAIKMGNKEIYVIRQEYQYINYILRKIESLKQVDAKTLREINAYLHPFEKELHKVAMKVMEDLQLYQQYLFRFEEYLEDHPSFGTDLARYKEVSGVLQSAREDLTLINDEINIYYHKMLDETGKEIKLDSTHDQGSRMTKGFGRNMVEELIDNKTYFQKDKEWLQSKLDRIRDLMKTRMNVDTVKWIEFQEKLEEIGKRLKAVGITKNVLRRYSGVAA